ncbi:MAG: hypothetical protein WCJ69_02645 [Betaproteobacteria bacterium]|jgi:hypothetical protein
MNASTGNAVLDTLSAVAGRLRAQRRIDSASLALASALAILIVAVVLGAILAPTSLARWPWTAALVLLGAIAAALAWSFRSRVSLQEAARAADTAGGLRDALKSSLWFLEQGAPSPWESAFLERAAGTARALDPRKLVPLRLPGAGRAAAGLAALLVVALALAPRLTPRFDAHRETAAPAPAPAVAGARDAGRELLEDLTRSGDVRARTQLEKTLSALDDSSRSAEERRRAVESVRQLAAQRSLEAAASREQMRTLAESLDERKGFEEVAQALRSGDARAAAELLRERSPGARAPEGDGRGGSVGAVPQEPDPKAAETLRESLEAAISPPDGTGETEGRMSRAVQNLEEIARRLDGSASLNNAARKLAQVSTALKRETTLRAARFGRQQSDGNPSASPETGDADIKGGTMFRLGAVAQQKPKDGGRESNRAGDSTGNAPGDPVVGDEARRIDVRYRREGVRGAEGDVAEGADSAFYAASRQGEAKVDYQAVQHRYRHVGEEALSPERIALRHRSQVRGFFLENAESAR